MPGGRATSEGRILVVDDESAIRLICRVNLDSAGFKTLEAGDGETGVSLAHSEQPDLILLDIMLPGMDG
jgi:DNA-binding response OmpR family regulator